jgi:hypothetical protein
MKTESKLQYDMNTLSKAKFKYIDLVLQADIDRVGIAEAVLRLYKEVDSELDPRIFIVDGPKQTALYLRTALGIVDDSQISRITPLPLEFGQFENAKNLADGLTLRSQVQAEMCMASLNACFSNAESQEMRNMIFWDLNFQLSRAIYHRAKDSQLFQFNKESYLLRPSNSPSWEDLDWVGFYGILQSNLNKASLNDSLTHDFLINGGFQIYAYDTFAIVCVKPKLIQRNENLVLHAEESASLKWEDGSEAFFWDGIEIPARLIHNPDEITADDILKETNAEVRRCYQEILGSEKFGTLLGLTPIDEKRDRFGNELILYRTKDVDKLAGDHIYFAKVVCPSTGRNYFLCVPPKIRSVEEAVAWTFGKTVDQYKPWIET